MKYLAIPAALVAAFLSTGCSETVQVCDTYGNRTVCRSSTADKQAKVRMDAICDYLGDCD